MIFRIKEKKFLANKRKNLENKWKKSDDDDDEKNQNENSNWPNNNNNNKSMINQRQILIKR